MRYVPQLVQAQQALMIHRAVGEGGTPSFIPPYHFHPLTNIQTFIKFKKMLYLFLTSAFLTGCSKKSVGSCEYLKLWS